MVLFSGDMTMFGVFAENSLLLWTYFTI